MPSEAAVSAGTLSSGPLIRMTSSRPVCCGIKAAEIRSRIRMPSSLRRDTRLQRYGAVRAAHGSGDLIEQGRSAASLK
jgi:hypothetical protein